MIESRTDVMDLLNAYLITQHECTHQFWMPKSEGWSGKKEAAYSNGIVLGKFRENDEATMQMLKIGVENEALKEETRLKIERDIKALEQLEELDFIQKGILSSQKREMKELQTLSMDEWIEKNSGWLESNLQEITNFEKRVFLYLYYSFENFKYERNNTYCCDIPAFKGFEIFINNHDSMFYGIGLCVISAYIFYIFQVIIPRFIRYKQVRSIKLILIR